MGIFVCIIKTTGVWAQRKHALLPAFRKWAAVRPAELGRRTVQQIIFRDADHLALPTSGNYALPVSTPNQSVLWQLVVTDVRQDDAGNLQVERQWVKLANWTAPIPYDLTLAPYVYTFLLYHDEGLEDVSWVFQVQVASDLGFTSLLLDTISMAAWPGWMVLRPGLIHKQETIRTQ